MSLVRKINFEKCPSLENVIFGVSFDVVKLLEQDDLNTKYVKTIADVRKLYFNPKYDVKSFGMENIFCLHIILQGELRK